MRHNVKYGAASNNNRNADQMLSRAIYLGTKQTHQPVLRSQNGQ